MYRYLIMHWRVDAPTQVAAATRVVNLLLDRGIGWAQAAAGTGYAVWHAGVRARASDTLVLPHARGAVCGTLFATDGSAAALSVIGEAEAMQILLSDCRRITEHYWGRYVAVLQSMPPGTLRVIRDPSGGLPAYLTRWQGVDLVVSDVLDLIGLQDFRPAINWQYVAALTLRRDLQDRETGLGRISEIQPGECITLGNGEPVRSWYWRPTDIAARVAPLGPELGEEVRTTTRACVQAWASCYDGIVHRLSGGLDSSIVLSCLVAAAGPSRVTCLNEFISGAAGDEREFARLAARHHGTDLVERYLDPTTVDLRGLLRVRPSPRPWFYVYWLEHTRFTCALARARGANVIMSGSGGDALFYRGRVQLAAIDFMNTHGFHGLFRTALEAARVERTSVWRVLHDVVWGRGRSERRAQTLPLAVAGSLVSAEVAAEVLRHWNLVPPALRDADPSRPGKWAQMRAMAVPSGFYDPLGEDDDPESVTPLTSQPLVELCLSIPTYVAITGGIDRAVARQAFKVDIPEAIRRRRGKGSTTERVKAIFERNLPFIRELLLDGALAREGIIDRGRLDASLSRRAALTSSRFADLLLDHVTTEVWIQRWWACSGHSARRAA